MSKLYADQEQTFWKLTKNSAQCLVCYDIIESKYRHDFVRCSCAEISIDGGLEYFKRSALDFKNFKDLSESRKFTVSELENYISYYSRQLRVDKLFSSSYYETTISSAKYFLNLWYHQFEP